MSFTPHGKHLIAGKFVETNEKFSSDPAQGKAYEFSKGSADLIDQACQAAEAAFWSYGYSARHDRADFLDAIADEIEARGPDITEIGSQETGLPKARLEGERGRTTGQLRLFANHIRAADYLDLRQDEALPNRQPAPRPEIRLVQRPIGPVAVFGASNFPLAFSTAGGDTASALAAGSPVVVKGHPAHPATAELIAEAILAAIQKCNLDPGVFSLVQDGGPAVGAALVQHPLIKAVGFTGSLRGGRALYDLCAARSEPIPFFGELGSVNPMFILPHVLSEKAETLGQGWAGSLTLGAGQFCTNPGIALVPEGADGDRFISAARDALAKAAPQTMLTPAIAQAYRQGQARFDAHKDVTTLFASTSEARSASPNLYETTAEHFCQDHTLAQEVFGPLALIVRVKNTDQMAEIAKGFEGQLTSTIWMTADDAKVASTLLPILERKAGRVLFNGYPTGVEVVDSMVHGGPYPASTNFGATAVGTLSIRRFLRPVSYQNMPAELWPDYLG